jgi:hypothetical protein
MHVPSNMSTIRINWRIFYTTLLILKEKKLKNWLKLLRRYIIFLSKKHWGLIAQTSVHYCYRHRSGLCLIICFSLNKLSGINKTYNDISNGQTFKLLDYFAFKYCIIYAIDIFFNLLDCK